MDNDVVIHLEVDGWVDGHSGVASWGEGGRIFSDPGKQNWKEEEKILQLQKGTILNSLTLPLWTGRTGHALGQTNM